MHVKRTADPGMAPSRRSAVSPPKSGGARHLADAAVVGVADIDRAVRSDDRAVRTVEPGIGGRTAVAAGALAAAGERADDAARPVDAADCVVLGIDDDQAAVAVDRHFLG